MQVGDCIGEMALLPGSVYIVTSTALTPSIVLVLQREELVDIAAQHAPLMRSIVSWLARRIVSSQCFTPQHKRTGRKAQHKLPRAHPAPNGDALEGGLGDDEQKDGPLDMDELFDSNSAMGLRQRPAARRSVSSDFYEDKS
jgi:hypothetical protein